MPLYITYTIFHDNFGSYILFCDQIATFETEIHAKRYVIHIYFRLFSCKNKLDLEHCIAFIVPCLFPLLLKLIAIDVLLV